MRMRRRTERRCSASSIRRVAATLPGLALALALGGCFLGTERPDAALDVPPAYRNPPARTPDAALPSVSWWRGFHSKQLTDLIEESLTSNLDIAVAVAKIVQADANSRITGAALLPALDFNASGTRSQSPGASPRNVISASFSASYEVDFWGKNRAALRAIEETAVATRFDREVVALSTMVSVANAYFQVLGAADRLRVARNNLAAATRVYNLIQERFGAGVASELDTSQQESVVNTVRASIPPLQLILDQNIATLAVLIARPPERIKVRPGSMSQIRIPPVTPGIPSDLLAQRPDVREAEAVLASANASVESARAAFFPTISLTGDGGYQSVALRTLLRPESAFFSLAAGLTQPVLDGLRLEGQYDLQKGRQDEALQLYRKTVLNAFADVERALIAVQQTTERERLQRIVVTSSRRAFEISERRLREGNIDLVTVLQTQQTLFQAEDTLATARLARLLAVVSLFQALGGGWQMPVEDGQTRP